jgi:hypothetical protein
MNFACPHGSVNGPRWFVQDDWETIRNFKTLDMKLEL